MSTSLKNLLLVLFLFFISLFVSFYIIDFNQNIKTNIILNTHLKTLQTYYSILMHNQKITADSAFVETIRNKKFMEIFKKANEAKRNADIETLDKLRQEAKNLLREKYKILKLEGVLQYHFVFPDNKVFLRMHKTNKYGDDLSSVRKDFKFTNENLKIVRGFAQGRTSHGFRNVYPILMDEQEHLGALEISFSSELLQNYFTRVSKIHTHFLVNKNIFQSHAWKRDDLILEYVQSSEHHEHMMTITSRHTKQKCIIDNTEKLLPQKKKIDSFIEKAEMFSILLHYKNENQIVSFYPVMHSVTNEAVAWIVSYTNDDLLDGLLKNTKSIKIITFIALLILFCFIYYVLYEIVKNKEKDRILFEQTKMAALGEMIGNIAHQWRQPLSAISTGVSGMLVQKEMGILKDEDFESTCKAINNNTQYLSKTIDDFRDFIKGNTEKKEFNVSEAINSFLNLVSSSITKSNLNITLNIQKDIKIKNLQNALNQSLLNIFNNAKDALENIEDERHILISVLKKENKVIIEINDNAGGIPEDIINKIFEPYFTTKHQSQGTGLGLNMTYRLITESMNGKIYASNDFFIINEKKYYGTKFKIILPL